MKIRKGFVSNSSSSSFTIIVKNKDKKLDQSMIRKCFDIPEGNPLYPLTVEFSNILKNRVQLYTTLEQYKENTEFDEDEMVKCAFESGYVLYFGLIYTDDGEEEQILAALNIDYEDEDIIIKGGEGY